MELNNNRPLEISKLCINSFEPEAAALELVASYYIKYVLVELPGDSALSPSDPALLNGEVFVRAP